jgi:molecular chaperone DnaK (HSP70)
MAETTTGGVTPKQSPYVFGIDLGTSNSGIAVFIDGRATLFQIEEGNKGCASVMSVRDNGDILVGREARRRLMIDPENTVASVKREMGTRWTKEFTGLPGEVYTPTDVSAEILGRLINGALQAGTPDIKGTPHKAVICIPANFDDAKKEATKEAGELAGLEVEWLLEEPVAAAIAYAFERDRDQTILVYDLGGGTFDVSVLKVDSSAGGTAGLRILAKEGVPRLGGDDFDLEIMKVAAARFQATSGLDVLDEKKDQGISVKSLREAQQKLKDAAETAKWELTESQSAQITIPNFIKSEDGNVHNLDCEIKRGEFNDAVRPLLLQSKEAVERALSALVNSGMSREDAYRLVQRSAQQAFDTGTPFRDLIAAEAPQLDLEAVFDYNAYLTHLPEVFTRLEALRA